MTVISASSAGVKDMADGSLRITFEFEPRHAADAFALFGPRGRSVAIAALVDGHGAIVDDEQPVSANPLIPKNSVTKPEKEREPLGDLCWRAVQWCKEPEFWSWMASNGAMAFGESEDGAKKYILYLCGVTSRRGLDTNPEAARKFNQLIRGPYQKHLISRGIVR